MIDRPSVVSGKYNERVLPHVLLLQRTHKLANSIVHVQRHGGVEPAIMGADRTSSPLFHQSVDFFHVELGHLQWSVNKMERIIQEERLILLGHVVVSHGSECVLFENKLLIASRIRFFAGLAGMGQRHCITNSSSETRIVHGEVYELAEAIVHFTSRCENVALSVVVVGMTIIADEGLEASALGRVLGRCHANIPFADHVGAVTPQAQLLSEACHVSWDAPRTAHGVVAVVESRWHVDGVYVHGQAATHQGGARRRAHLVGIVPFQKNAGIRQGIKIWSVHLCLSLLLLGGGCSTAMKSNVGPAIIVR
mmetsp:Transcript_74419/g.218177  ORF Transcript_74419/g.218177 Transcript_74419/m.218177 type:complete len:308 (+) Transcript_74419:1105-2028(+)